MKKRILLVEPNFPFPNKSKNKANFVHKNFVPIGLLKFGAMHKEMGDEVKLIRGNKKKDEVGFDPDKILVTSLFTYWSDYVWSCILHYRELFPASEIWLGGIYATLHKDTKKFKDLLKRYRVKVNIGVNCEAEKFLPDYSLIEKIDYHATHMMRGCIRNCKFCGTWKIEPERTNKNSEEIISELKKIGKNKVVFYDNNLLANPYIRDILSALSEIKIKDRPIVFESQSGFDGRLLENDPQLANLIKKAKFQNIRIAWDKGLKDKDSIKKQIYLLIKAGYPAKDVSIFMIYNFEISYEDMLKKLKCCEKWGVQITDCRFRPLELDYDNYNPHMRHGQPNGSFYIHKQSGWTDKKVRDFRSKVRRHNIEIRYAKDKGLKYDNKMEKWSAIHNTYKFFNLGRPPKMEKIEKSERIKKTIINLNKIKNYYKKNNLTNLDFSKFSKNEVDNKIQKIILESFK